MDGTKYNKLACELFKHYFRIYKYLLISCLCYLENNQPGSPWNKEGLCLSFTSFNFKRCNCFGEKEAFNLNWRKCFKRYNFDQISPHWWNIIHMLTYHSAKKNLNSRFKNQFGITGLLKKKIKKSTMKWSSLAIIPNSIFNVFDLVKEWVTFVKKIGSALESMLFIRLHRNN